jgi:hypothetical protein
MLNFFHANPNKFIVCGASEVSLYEVKDKDHVTDFSYDCPRLQSLSKKLFRKFLSFFYAFSFETDNLKFVSQLDSTVAYLSSEKRYQYIKCAAPSFHRDELIVACGQNSGKVSIVNFSPTSENYLEFSECFGDYFDGGLIVIFFQHLDRTGHVCP